MRLPRYLIRRILQLIPMVLVVIVLNFLLMQLAPGDVAYIMAGEEPDPAYLAHVREQYGLDKPVLQQMFIYLGQIVQGDLGLSYRYRKPVIEVIGRYVGPTVLLMFTSLTISFVVGVVFGTLLARRRGSTTDVVGSVLAVALYSIPVFWLGLMLILFFSIRLGWFPFGGMRTILGPKEGLPALLDLLKHMALPALTLSTVWLGQYVRLARSSVVQVLNEDFITSVRAIGFGPRVILVRHALRNALLPVVSVFGLQLGLALSGAVLTETVFSWPGLGRMIYEGILARDTPVIMGAYIVLSICVAIASLLTDLVYVALDPRVELQ